MLGLSLNYRGNVIMHCRDHGGIVHLAEVTPDGLEEAAVHSNARDPVPLTTECLDLRDNALVGWQTLDVYWVNTDTVPTCLRCVGSRRL